MEDQFKLLIDAYELARFFYSFAVGKMAIEKREIVVLFAPGEVCTMPCAHFSVLLLYGDNN